MGRDESGHRSPRWVRLLGHSQLVVVPGSYVSVFYETLDDQRQVSELPLQVRRYRKERRREVKYLTSSIGQATAPSH